MRSATWLRPSGRLWYGKPSPRGLRLRGLLQRMEYVRYQQSIARRTAITPVLSGTATAFRLGTLDRLVRERGFVCARQLLLAGAMLARLTFVPAVAGTLVVTGGMSVNWLFAGLAGIVAFERAWTIRELGPGACAAGLALVVQESYGIFREAFWCRSLWLSLRRRDWVWHTT